MDSDRSIVKKIAESKRTGSANRKIRGLGDALEVGFTYSGIKAVSDAIHTALQMPCNCNRRKTAYNRKYPLYPANEPYGQMRYDYNWENPPNLSGNIKLGLMTQEFTVGGIERYFYDLQKMFVTTGYRVRLSHILYWEAINADPIIIEKLKELGVEVVYSGSSKYRDRGGNSKYISNLNDATDYLFDVCDMITIGNLGNKGNVLINTDTQGKDVLLLSHGEGQFSMNNNVNCLPFATKIAAVSDDATTSFPEEISVDKRLYALACRQSSIPKKPINLYKPVLGFIGRLADEKGILGLIDTAIQYNYELKIAGAGYREVAVKEKIEGHKNIEFLGRVDNIDDLLKKIDVGVIPSSTEGGPITFLEFALNGIPVCATKCGLLKSDLTKGTFSEIEKPATADSIHNAIKRVSHINAIDAMSYVFRYHSWDNILRQWDILLAPD